MACLQRCEWWTRVGLSGGMVPRVLHVAWVSDLLEALRHAVLICSAVSFPCRLSAFLPSSDAELEALMILHWRLFRCSVDVGEVL